MIRTTEFLLKNRIFREAPTIDGNIVGDRNTLRTCHAKCSNVIWDILDGYGAASKWSHGSELSPNRLTSAEIWPELSVSYINNNFPLTRVLDDVGAAIDIVTILIYCYYDNVQINSERRIL